MPRFRIETALTVQIHIDAADISEAHDNARKALFSVNFADAFKGIPTQFPGAHAQVAYGATKGTQVEVRDYSGLTDPEARLFAIFETCFKHGGPRLAFSDSHRELAKAAYAAIPEGPSKLRAHAAFDDYGVDLGTAICTPAIFTGEWFGYEQNTYDLGIRGFDNGSRWNGWACPLFDLKGIAAIVEWQNAQDKESLAGVDQLVITTNQDGHCVVATQYCADNGGELVEILPSTYETTQGQQALYEVGNGWCWEVFTKDYPNFKVLVG